MRPVHFVAFVVGLGLLAPRAAPADIIYKIQPIVKAGDRVGNVPLRKSSPDFGVGGLNDNGLIIFYAGGADEKEVLVQYAAGKFTPIVKAGDKVGDLLVTAFLDEGSGPNNNGQSLFIGIDPNGNDELFQYADGQLTLILAAGREAPGGTWSQDVRVHRPLSMNQLGDAVFAAEVTVSGDDRPGTFRWDAQARKVTPVALEGLPVVNGLTFTFGEGIGSPVINNKGDIAFLASVKDPAGDPLPGLFFQGHDGNPEMIALSGQALPGGDKLSFPFSPAINDAGVIAFGAVRTNVSEDAAYLWENGTITTRVVAVGAEAPDGGKIVEIDGIWLNNKNANVLVEVQLNDSSNGPQALYLFAAGKLTPVAVPGQEMPEGGTLSSVYAISPANDLGQHVFLAALKDGVEAAYRMDADGKLSLLLRSGMTTELGKVGGVISNPDDSVSLNNKGQVALTIELDTTSPTDAGDAIVLLTPS